MAAPLELLRGLKFACLSFDRHLVLNQLLISRLAFLSSGLSGCSLALLFGSQVLLLLKPFFLLLHTISLVLIEILELLLNLRKLVLA